jgi:hypothetical protein
MHQGCVRSRQRRREGSGRVVADIAKLTVGREAYYTREPATDHQQYLSGHGESPGRWYGAGAASLGLQGKASPGGFQAMFEGRDPTTGELLDRPHSRNAVPAFDVVLRPTKSVSILYGPGDPGTGRAVLAAHHAGLAEAVGYLDEHLGARRGHGGVQHVSGQGLLAVGFDHRTSREGDPLLHIHMVIANRVQGPDDRWTAADAHGNRELAGMPKELVRSFCKRTDPIDAELDRLTGDGGQRTPRLVKWTVQATRKPKEHEAPDTLCGRWRTEAAERGVDADTLVRKVTGRTELEELADRFLAERAVSVVADRALEERRWSTPQLLAVEEQLVTNATGRTDERTAMVSHEAVHEALAAHPTAGEDTSRRWSGTCARAAKGLRWWSGGRGRARPSPWGSPGTPGNWTATGCSPPLRLGSRP